MLKFLEFVKKSEVHNNASDIAIGGVLMQDDHPVTSKSRKLTGSHLNWPTHGEHLYAVIHCLESWMHNVGGKKTNIFTNNMSLKYLDNKAQTTPKELG